MFCIKNWILLLWLCTSTLSAQTYLLNPYHQKDTPSSLLLSRTDEDRWLKVFYQRVPLTFPINRRLIKDDSGEALDQKMKKATQKYLELEFESATELTDDSTRILTQSLPYKTLAADWIELRALDFLIHEGLRKSELRLADIPTIVQPFLKNEDFLNKLPLKTQSSLRGLKIPTTFKVANLPTSFERLFYLGAEIHLPRSFEVGRHLVHLLRDGNLEACWLDVPEGGKSSLQKIWSRPIWKTVATEQLRIQLEAAKPSSLAPGGILVLIQEGPPLLISEVPLEQRNLSLKKKLGDPFSTNLGSEEETGPSILKSPWFWVITTVVAGTASYFIYDSMQTKTVTTP